MSSYYNLLASKNRATFPPSLLLDLFPNASVAYSLRKLRTAYSGSAIRVRRSSDNAEQDINFVGGDLDTQSLLDFVGYNLWTYSEEFNNAVWIKSNLNTTGTPSYIDVETAPDSTLTGDKVIENTASDLHGFFRTSPTLVIGTTYNLSVYLKQGERTKVRILSSAGAANQRCDIDLTNGNISNNTFANTPVITSESNGWYRFSISITATVTTTTDFFTLRLFNASNAITYTGDGTSGAYVWGFQLTQSSSVLPYTKTVATVAGNGFVTTWYDQSGNSLNLTQTTAGSQPRIVLSGVVETVNGKSALNWTNGLNQRLTVNFTNIPQPISFFSVSKLSAASGINASVLFDSFNNVQFIFFNKGTIESPINNLSFAAGVIPINFGLSNTNQNNYNAIINGANSSLYQSNNVVSAQFNSGVNNLSGLSVGHLRGNPNVIAGGYDWSGQIQELIIYASNQSTDRSNIVTNIDNFYGL